MRIPGEKRSKGIWIIIFIIIVIILFLLWKKPELIDSIKSIIFGNP